MKTFDMRYKNGYFLHQIFNKVGYKIAKTKRKKYAKVMFWTARQSKTGTFFSIFKLNFYSKFCIPVKRQILSSIILPQIAYKMSFPSKFLKNLKGLWLLCQKILDHKSLQESSGNI